MKRLCRRIRFKFNIEIIKSWSKIRLVKENFIQKLTRCIFLIQNLIFSKKFCFRIMFFEKAQKSKIRRFYRVKWSNTCVFERKLFHNLWSFQKKISSKFDEWWNFLNKVWHGHNVQKLVPNLKRCTKFFFRNWHVVEKNLKFDVLEIFCFKCWNIQKRLERKSGSFWSFQIKIWHVVWFLLPNLAHYKKLHSNCVMFQKICLKN